MNRFTAVVTVAAILVCAVVGCKHSGGSATDAKPLSAGVGTKVEPSDGFIHSDGFMVSTTEPFNNYPIQDGDVIPALYVDAFEPTKLCVLSTAKKGNATLPSFMAIKEGISDNDRNIAVEAWGKVCDADMTQLLKTFPEQSKPPSITIADGKTWLPIILSLPKDLPKINNDLFSCDVDIHKGSFLGVGTADNDISFCLALNPENGLRRFYMVKCSDNKEHIVFSGMLHFKPILVQRLKKLSTIPSAPYDKRGGKTDPQRAAAATDELAFMSALNMYKADTGCYPTPDQGLRALVVNPGVPGWNNPYLDNMPVIKADPWGNPYIYQKPSQHGQEFDIISAGPDGRIGTPDDVESWNFRENDKNQH